VDENQCNASSFLCDENSIVNSIPQFDSSINFTENKGLPLRLLGKDDHTFIQPKPYKRFSTDRINIKNVALNIKTKNL
jgi:hypothetical protein